MRNTSNQNLWKNKLLITMTVLIASLLGVGCTQGSSDESATDKPNLSKEDASINDDLYQQLEDSKGTFEDLTNLGISSGHVLSISKALENENIFLKFAPYFKHLDSPEVFTILQVAPKGDNGKRGAYLSCFDSDTFFLITIYDGELSYYTNLNFDLGSIPMGMGVNTFLRKMSYSEVRYPNNIKSLGRLYESPLGAHEEAIALKKVLANSVDAESISFGGFHLGMSLGQTLQHLKFQLGLDIETQVIIGRSNDEPTNVIQINVTDYDPWLMIFSAGRLTDFHLPYSAVTNKMFGIDDLPIEQFVKAFSMKIGIEDLLYEELYTDNYTYIVSSHKGYMVSIDDDKTINFSLSSPEARAIASNK